MKILVVCKEFPSLTETFILNQITGFIDLGHDVDIYALASGKRSILHPDIKKYRLEERTIYRGLPANFLLRFLKVLGYCLMRFCKEPNFFIRVARLFADDGIRGSIRSVYDVFPFFERSCSDYDIIHCHFGPNGVRGVVLGKFCNPRAKIVTTFHGYDISKYIDAHGRRVYDRLFDRGELFLPISDRWKLRLSELGCPENKIVVHKMGIDCSRFDFEAKTMFRNGVVKFVSVCRLVEKKGLEYGLRAFARLFSEGYKCKYTIVGDGPLKGHLINLVRDLGVSHVVRILGWKDQQEVVEILKRSHILLAPSVTSKTGGQEGIPVTVMEGMALGLPVVSTLHSGIPELVVDGVSGFLVPERDVEALFEKMEYLVKHPKQWPKIGLQGRKHVERYHDIKALNKGLIEVFQNLLRKRRQK